MTALDLTQSPPRSPRAELRGLCMLPRMIDVARAKLPGGNIGEYQIGRGLSGVVLGTFGISADEFVELVRNAGSEEEIADQLWQRSAVPAAALTRRLSRVTVANVPADLLADFQRFYGADVPPTTRIFDLLEEDDRQSFSKSAAS